MASIYGLSFPLLGNREYTLHDATISLIEGQHDYAVITVVNANLPTYTLKMGSPISFSYGNPPRPFTGYVHHYEPFEDGVTRYLKIYALGASYVMSSTHHRSFQNITATTLVRRIATEHKFTVEAVNHPRIYKQLTQSGQSDWQMLRRLAEETGYFLWADGTTLRFYNRDYKSSAKRSRAPRIAKVPSIGTQTFKFTPLIGDDLPQGNTGKATRTLYASDGNMQTTTGKPKKGQKTTVLDPMRSVIERNVIAGSISEAKYLSEGLDESARWTYKAQLSTITGNSYFIPGEMIYLMDNPETTTGEFWTIISAEHYLRNASHIVNMLIGTDSLGTTNPALGPTAAPERPVRDLTADFQYKLTPTSRLSNTKTPIKQSEPESFQKLTNKWQAATAISYRPIKQVTIPVTLGVRK